MLVGLRGEGKAERVRCVLICSRLIMLYGNGGGNVSLERGRDISPCYLLMTDRAVKFIRKEKDEGMIWPDFGERVCYVLE